MQKEDWNEIMKTASSAFKITYFIAIAVAMHHLMAYAASLEFTGKLITYLGTAILAVEFTSKSIRFMLSECSETWTYIKHLKK